METIYEIYEGMCVAMFVIGVVLIALYFALKAWYDNRPKIIRVDDKIFKNVKFELNKYCNEVMITFPKEKRTVTLTYEEFEILKD